jgi:hypothetical protein
MFIEELELLLAATTSFEQLADGLEPNGPVAQSNLTRLIDRISRIAVSQAQQAHQYPNPGNAACFQDQAGPALRMHAEQSRPLQQPGRALFHLGDLARMDMLLLRLEGAGLNLDVEDDLFHLAVEDPHQVTIPADPDLSTGVLRRDRVVGLPHFDVTVAVHGPAALLEAGNRPTGSGVRWSFSSWKS